MTRLAVFLATAGYSGYFPIAPGTVGSAAGLAVYGLLRWSQTPLAPLTEIALIVALFAAGVWAATTAERYFGGIDPGPIVLDEVVGMLITLAFIPVGPSAPIHSGSLGPSGPGRSNGCGWWYVNPLTLAIAKRSSKTPYALNASSKPRLKPGG